MSMTRALLVRRVVQPDLFRVSGNSEGKGNDGDKSSECCLSDDMRLPLSESESVSRRVLATCMPTFRGAEVEKIV